MFEVKETTTAEVYAHALDDDTKPIFKGTEVFHEDIHDHVTYHADLAAEAVKAVIER